MYSETIFIVYESSLNQKQKQTNVLKYIDKHLSAMIRCFYFDREWWYYVSVVYDIIDIKNNNFISRSIVEIDLGIKKLLTLSYGIIYI